MEKKNLVMVCLCAAIAIMAVAYAAFSTTLTVEGSVEATGTFNVHYVQVGDGKCTPTVTKGLTASEGTITTNGDAEATLNVKLVTPGDEVTCTVTVKNEGTISAKLVDKHAISNSLTGTTEPIAVTANTTKQVLTPGQEDTLTVLVKYNWEAETQPDSSKTSASFTIQSNYQQAF